MVAFSILEQPNPTPGASVIKSAYRQIRFTVYSDATVDATLPMYADIYCGPQGAEVYYKTISSYTIMGLSGVMSGLGYYQFDIQDALQEYVKSYLPTIPVSTMQQTDTTDPLSGTWVIVYFRGSSLSGGLLVPETPVPVQATATTPASAGGGLASNEFWVLGASVLPYYDNDILSNPLEIAMGEKKLVPVFTSTARIYPMSNLPLSPRYGLAYVSPDPLVTLSTYRNNFGGFPINIIEWAPSGLLSPYYRNCKVRLFVATETISMGVYDLTATALKGPGTYSLPIGLEEIEAAIGSPTMATILNDPGKWYYQVCLYDVDAGTYAFFTPWYKFATSVIEGYRICFLNTYGQFEWVTFARNSKEFKSTSGQQFNPVFQNFASTNVKSLGHRRISIRANDEISLTATFSEFHQPWLQELIESPAIFIENPDGSPDFLSRKLTPAIIKDHAIVVKRSVKDGRLNYVVNIKIQPAWDYIPQRN